MRNTLFVMCTGLFSLSYMIFAAPMPRDLVTDPAGKNQLLVVGVPGGLTGIDKDLKMVEEIGANPAYNFISTKLWSSQGTVANVAQELTKLSTHALDTGTMFFYYSGHGSRGSISLKDRSMKISEIRQALEKGREGLGPVSRLVMMFDSCYSGSLVDPLRKLLNPLFEKEDSAQFAENVMEEFKNSQRDSDYWKSLFVFASSRASETSNAGSEGSEFTVALKKAFLETLKGQGTMAEWVIKTKEYTQGHHPVERFSPVDLANEKLIP